MQSSGDKMYFILSPVCVSYEVQKILDNPLNSIIIIEGN